MSLMFKDVPNDILRSKYLVHGSATHAKTLNFEYFCKLGQAVCRQLEEEEKLNFLFDMFAGYQDNMKWSSLLDFAQIFGLTNDVLHKNM